MQGIGAAACGVKAAARGAAGELQASLDSAALFLSACQHCCACLTVGCWVDGYSLVVALASSARDARAAECEWDTRVKDRSREHCYISWTHAVVMAHITGAPPLRVCRSL
jgi:hypothetical protein